MMKLKPLTAGARIATLLATATLTACATTDRPAPVTRRVETPAPAPKAASPNVVLTPAPAPVIPRVPGPPASSFVGGPVERLEDLLGEPALVRREGGSEFRRYDVTGDCRAFAVVTGGQVASLRTGGAIQGAPAPAFEDCTARDGFAGS